MNLSLADCGCPASLDEHHQVVEADDAEAGRAFDQQVQQVGGGERVVERAVTRPVVETEP